VAKEHPNSKRYIDLTAAAIMGHDRACGPVEAPPAGPTPFFIRS
jgi:hypothetical protein